MQESAKYDVIIIGSGPAGALLGYLLAVNHIKVAVLERKKIPRYKPCGGGLTRKALDTLPFDIDPVIEDYIFKADILVNNRVVYSHESAQPLIGMVMRDKFDFFMSTKAVEAGADLYEKTAFQSLSGTVGNLQVKAGGRILNARLIVGADGAISRVARVLGITAGKKYMTALEGEISYENHEILNKHRHMAHFDFGIISGGYGWVFPKKNHLSVGVLTVQKERKRLKQFLNSYLKLKGLDGYSEMKPLKGHVIPYGIDEKKVFADQRGLLVGDAAGIADPVTGEGLYYAFREAFIASNVISKALNSGLGFMEEYNNMIREEFLKDLVRAGRMGCFFYKFKWLSYKILELYGNRLGDRFIQIITGKGTYSELYRRVFKFL